MAWSGGDRSPSSVGCPSLWNRPRRRGTMRVCTNSNHPSPSHLTPTFLSRRLRHTSGINRRLVVTMSQLPLTMTSRPICDASVRRHWGPTASPYRGDAGMALSCFIGGRVRRRPGCGGMLWDASSPIWLWLIPLLHRRLSHPILNVVGGRSGKIQLLGRTEQPNNKP